MVRDEVAVVESLIVETGLTEKEAWYYLNLLRKGSVPATNSGPPMKKLLAFGMAILSGDNKRYIPVHPRLAVANSYRTWRESMVREINERRMRVDKLILELIPLYEAATVKKPEKGGR